MGELCVFTLNRAAVSVSDSVTDKHREAGAFPLGTHVNPPGVLER